MSWLHDKIGDSGKPSQLKWVQSLVDRLLYPSGCVFKSTDLLEQLRNLSTGKTVVLMITKTSDALFLLKNIRGIIKEVNILICTNRPTKLIVGLKSTTTGIMQGYFATANPHF